MTYVGNATFNLNFGLKTALYVVSAKTNEIAEAKKTGPMRNFIKHYFST